MIYISPGLQKAQDEQEARQYARMGQELVVYAFTDCPVRIVWIHRTGAVVSESVSTAPPQP